MMNKSMLPAIISAVVAIAVIVKAPSALQKPSHEELIEKYETLYRLLDKKILTHGVDHVLKAHDDLFIALAQGKIGVEDAKKNLDKMMEALESAPFNPPAQLKEWEHKKLLPTENKSYFGNWHLRSFLLSREYLGADPTFAQVAGQSGKVLISFIDIPIQDPSGKPQNMDEPILWNKVGILPPPTIMMKAQLRRGAVPAIQLHLFDSNSEGWMKEQGWTIDKSKQFDVADVNDGKLDDYLEKQMRILDGIDYPMILLFINEFNIYCANLFGQSGKENFSDVGRNYGEQALFDQYGDGSMPDGPERVRDAWIRLRKIMDRVGASDHISLASHAAGGHQNPAFPANSSNRTNWNRLRYYWPGEGVIDYMGMSAYGHVLSKNKDELSLYGSIYYWNEEIRNSDWKNTPLFYNEFAPSVDQNFPEYDSEYMPKYIRHALGDVVPNDFPASFVLFITPPFAMTPDDEMRAFTDAVINNDFYAGSVKLEGGPVDGAAATQEPGELDSLNSQFVQLLKDKTPSWDSTPAVIVWWEAKVAKEKGEFDLARQKLNESIALIGDPKIKRVSYDEILEFAGSKKHPIKKGKLQAPKNGAYTGVWQAPVICSPLACPDGSIDKRTNSHTALVFDVVPWYNYAPAYSYLLSNIDKFSYLSWGELFSFEDSFLIKFQFANNQRTPLIISTKQYAELLAQYGSVLAIAWNAGYIFGNPPWAGGSDYHPEMIRDNSAKIQDILDGKWDIYIRKTAREVRDINAPLLIELTHEFNVGTMNVNAPWSFGENGDESFLKICNPQLTEEQLEALVGNPKIIYEGTQKGLIKVDCPGLYDQYGSPDIPDGPERQKDMWIHVKKIFDEENVTNVAWFEHTGDKFGTTLVNTIVPWNKLDYYWPGEGYIDFLGTSAYYDNYSLLEDDTISTDGPTTFLTSAKLADETRKTDKWKDTPVLLLEFAYTPSDKDLAIKEVFGNNIPNDSRLRSVKGFTSLEHFSSPPKEEEISAWKTHVSQNPYYVKYPVISGGVQDFTEPVTDDSPSKISITSPGHRSSVSGTVNVTVAVSRIAGVTKVEFHVDGELKGSAASGPYSFIWDTTNVSPGPHFLTAKAYGATGLVGTSERIKVTISSRTVAVAAGAAKSIVVDAETSRATVNLPVGAFASPVTLTVAMAQGLPASFEPELMATGIGLRIEVAGGLQPSKAVTIEATYQDSDVAGLDRNTLVLARYDEADRSWVRLASTADPSSRKVTGKTDHFSLFQVMGTAKAAPSPGDLGGVRIYPNPFYPNRGQDRVTLDGLPAGARVRIHTLLNELVWEGSADGSGVLRWTGVNRAGRRAASGLYRARIESGGKSRMKKLSVIR